VTTVILAGTEVLDLGKSFAFWMALSTDKNGVNAVANLRQFSTTTYRYKIAIKSIMIIRSLCVSKRLHRGTGVSYYSCRNVNELVNKVVI